MLWAGWILMSSLQKFLSCCGESLLSLVDFLWVSLSLSKLYVKSSGRVTTFLVVQRRPPVPSWHWIFDRDVPNQTCTKNSQNITGNSDTANTTCTVPHSVLFPSPEASRFSLQGEKKRRSVVTLPVIGGSRWPRTHRRALIFRLKNQNQTDTKAPHHMLNHPAFSVPSQGGAPRSAKIRRLGEDTELRKCTAGRNYTDPRLSFLKLKTLKNISSWRPGKKKHLCGFEGRMSKDCRDPKRWRTAVGKFLRGLMTVPLYSGGKHHRLWFVNCKLVWLAHVKTVYCLHFCATMLSILPTFLWNDVKYTAYVFLQR